MPKRSTLRLTKRTVDALVVKTKDTLFWDRDLAGFGVRVHATGRKCYVVQSRGPAGLKRVTLGRHGVLATEEARRQAAVVIDRLKRGEAPVLAPPAPPLTVADLAERFLRVHVKTHCKPSTAVTYRGHLDRHILPVLGAVALTAVGRAEVAALHQRLRDTPTTANAVVRTLSVMLTLAETWALISPGRNPCRAVRRYKQHPRERCLTVEEYRRLGRVLTEAERDGSVWPPAVAALRLLVLTGCRHSEIVSLRWDDIDHTAGELRLRDAKTGPRRVPLTAPVASVLAGIRRDPDNPWVIAGPKPRTRLSSLRHHWHRLRTRAGLDDVRIHDLRHSFASRALALGESLPTIGTLLGHRKMATTARYAHLMRDAEKGAATRVGDSIGAHLRPRIAEAA
ncbi:MAG: tyrosine-type recombinase/integrase [Thiotrichales bacterium]|nr:tyrosine-type recombinase/integrase [Thiotrichales bacterium]